MEGFAAPVKLTCDDHNGHNNVYVAQWDGTKCDARAPTGSQPMKDKVRPLLEAGRRGLCQGERRLAEAHRGLREGLVSANRAHLPGRLHAASAAPRMRDRRRDAEPCRIPPPAAQRSIAGCAEDRAEDERAMTAVTPHDAAPAATDDHPLGQQHRGHLRPRHPRAEGRVADRAAGRHRRAARRQRRGQDDDAEGDLQPAARRARRGDQGLDRVRGRARRRAVAQRARPARLHPGDGGPALLRPPHHRGEPAHRRLHAPRRQRRDQARPRRRSTTISRACRQRRSSHGRLHLRRRAADVRHRPRADVEAPR